MSTAGVNYPWWHYGGDFGPTVWGTHTGIATHAPEIGDDLARIAAAGVGVVRWFLFTDARGGIAVDGDGWPAGFLPGTLEDLDTLLELALAAGVRLVPVLFDHTLAFDRHTAAGAPLGGHTTWLWTPEGQARLLDAVVTPLASRYGAAGSHAGLGRAVHAWDLFNEPDWIVAELHPSPRVSLPVPYDVFMRWARQAAATLRRHRAGLVTLGVARLRFARWWDDDALDLDFLQVHAYYDRHHDFDLIETPCHALDVRRPIVVGECSARGEDATAAGRPALDGAALRHAAHALGYAGAWPWSWRGVDAHGPLIVPTPPR